MIKFVFENTEKFLDKQEKVTALEQSKATIARALHGDPAYKDALGWHNVDKWANEQSVKRILTKAAEIKANATKFVLIGIGGSNQAARAAIKALSPQSGVEVIYAGNTLSPYELAKIEKQLDGSDFYINVIAKNFETLEPGVSFRLLRTLLEKKYGDKAHERIIATGTIGSHLDELSQKHKYDFFTFPVDIGGRYSVFSDVGLLPMAVAGVDIVAMLEGAKDMQRLMLSDDSLANPAVEYAITRFLLYKKGYRMEMLSFFEPRFRYFSKWWTQLFAESEGKDGKGCYPIVGEYSEDLHSIGQYVQDGSPIIFETFLQVMNRDTVLFPEKDSVDDRFDYINGKDFWEINKAAETGTMSAHSACLPCVQIQMDELSTYNIGSIFYAYMLICAVSGALLEINPFDQNGVEAYKAGMFEILGK